MSDSQQNVFLQLLAVVDCCWWFVLAGICNRRIVLSGHKKHYTTIDRRSESPARVVLAVDLRSEIPVRVELESVDDHSESTVRAVPISAEDQMSEYRSFSTCGVATSFTVVMGINFFCFLELCFTSQKSKREFIPNDKVAKILRGKKKETERERERKKE